MDDEKKMRIAFIGAGKAGISLGAYFYSRGLKISGYLSRSADSSLSAAELTSSTAFLDLPDLVASSQMIFISTPDAAIEKTWKRLVKCNINGKFICHISGSLSSGVFVGIEEIGAYGYSVHPMFAFSSRDGNFEGLDKAFFTIEGSKDKLDEVRDIFRCLGNRTFIIDKSQKHLYHASNVMVSNLVTALLSIGAESFERCGVPEGDALQALMPLIKKNIDNIAKKGFTDSLTGPAERNDIETIMKHMNVLEKDERMIYSLLTKRLAMLSKMKHPERDQSDLLELLEK